MAIVIKPVVYPTDIRAYAISGMSGKLPEALMRPVGPSGRLHHLAARAFAALQFKCMSIGLPLTYTFGGCYRDYPSQRQLFVSRYAIGGKLGGCKVWDSNNDGRHETWCKKPVNGRTPATAARPGDSNHGRGVSIDVAFDVDFDQDRYLDPADAAAITGHPQWRRFQELVIEFGFAWELKEEPWHINYIKGDNLPQVVLDIEAFVAYLDAGNTFPPETEVPQPQDPAPVVTPTPSPVVTPPPVEIPQKNWSEQLVDQLATLRPGSTGGQVRILCGLLQAHGLMQNERIRDVFDETVRGQVLWFQGVKGLDQDAVVGPQTWSRLIQA